MMLGNLDFSFNNAALATILAFGSIIFFFFVSVFYNSFLVYPNRYFHIYKTIFLTSANMVIENAGKKGKFFIPYIFCLFFGLLVMNVLGMIPYNFTPTSHLIITYFLASLTFVFINVIGIKIHGPRILGLFLPDGAPTALIPLLIPIEFISYAFRTISLSVRLFANMMAGHTLLKVIGGFSWKMLKSGGALVIFHFVPLVVVFLLIGLELGVALIQAYVFTILSCIYLGDVIVLH